jgi:hypothetical protein
MQTAARRTGYYCSSSNPNTNLSNTWQSNTNSTFRHYTTHLIPLHCNSHTRRSAEHRKQKQHEYVPLPPHLYFFLSNFFTLLCNNPPKRTTTTKKVGRAQQGYETCRLRKCWRQTPPPSKIAGARKERRCWGLRADRRERERERERRETWSLRRVSVGSLEAYYKVGTYSSSPCRKTRSGNPEFF